MSNSELWSLMLMLFSSSYFLNELRKRSPVILVFTGGFVLSRDLLLSSEEFIMSSSFRVSILRYLLLFICNMWSLCFGTSDCVLESLKDSLESENWLYSFFNDSFSYLSKIGVSLLLVIDFCLCSSIKLTPLNVDLRLIIALFFFKILFFSWIAFISSSHF